MNTTELIGFTTHETLRRGNALFEAGNTTVDSIKGVLDETLEIRGSCIGSTGKNYQLSLTVSHSPWGSLRSAIAQCSCPVNGFCKHAVAIYLHYKIIREKLVQDARDADRWRSVLGEIFPSPEPEALFDDVLPHASILVSFVESAFLGGRKRYGISFRPVRPAKRPTAAKPFVTSDMTWTRIRNRSNFEVQKTQTQALQEAYKLLFRSSAYDTDEWNSLTQSAAMLWEAVSILDAAGVQFLDAHSFAPISIERENLPFATLDVSEGDDGWVNISPIFGGLDSTDPEKTAVFGNPANAVAWQDTSGGIHIAPLAAPPSSQWSTLLRSYGKLRIPPQDREEFEASFLPHITAATAWQSSDNSFVAADPEPPILVAHVGQKNVPVVNDQPNTVIDINFVFRYAIGSRNLEVPATQGHSVPSTIRRDAQAEQELLDHFHSLGVNTKPEQLSGKAALEFLDTGIADLESHGVVVVVDKAAESLSQWEEARNVSVTVGVDNGSNDWFSLAVTVLVDGKEASMAALIAALSSSDKLLFTEDGTYVDVDDPQFDELVALLDEARALSDPRRKSVLVPGTRISWWDKLEALDLVDVQPNEFLEKARAAARMDVGTIDIPDQINATLRPYQEEGFRWLAELCRRGMGGVLADDMGLGKTLQILSMIVDSQSALPDPKGPWLVVAPTSVAPNWVAEAKKFAPHLKVELISSSSKRRGESLDAVANRADVIVSTYALVRLDCEEYAELDFTGVVLDEAQNVKNPLSKAFHAIRDLKAPRVYAVTGTPIENSLLDAWSMFALTNPGLLGGVKQFKEHFERPIAHGESRRMEMLRQRTAPFLLRRRKADVALDLPPIQHQIINVELDKKHRKLYDLRLNRERQRVLKLIEEDPDNKIAVLAALTTLRQMAIDPSLVEEDTIAPSSKMEHLVSLLEPIITEGHRVLIFSQFTTYLRKVRDRLNQEGIATSYLDGTTTDRAKVIEDFKNGTDPVFLISLKAGGMGLNLTEADYVFVLDPWWNPAVEAQAIDRAHRIGQTMPVTVYRLVSTNTIEDRVLALQERKRELMESYLAPDSDTAQRTGGMQLDASSIRELLS